MTAKLRPSAPSSHPVRWGLCLGGGGILGAAYQIGCLAAIEDELPRFAEQGFDVVVGAASGATVALALAGGIPAGRIYRALLDPSDDFFALQRHHLIRLDGEELRRVARALLGTARRSLLRVTSNPLETDLWDELERFLDSLPAGLFTMDAYERFLQEFLARRAIPDEFEALPRTLRIVAMDLDGGRRAVFGAPPLDRVPLARAAAAAAAAPAIYAPVRIGERDYVASGVGDAAHVDVAAALGCTHILVLHPAVPVSLSPEAQREVPTGHGKRRRVRDKGLLGVYSQASRMAAHARLRLGLAAFAAERPDVVVELLEPGADDATLFLHSPMHFAARRAVLREAYTSTVRRLRTSDAPLRARLQSAIEPR